ncbi:glycosyltransferase [Corynebacterium coyleae]|uniref:glycosyltransferase n=1 Tax=Corynebacterium coyleae TaxID=53374 RepID=UPI00254F6DD5|nr:glycosyltransferase [Corynebacterium coyleae]MDK8823366.1 glycosyltransferase [Corynebacterium coyleae]
MGKSNVSKKFIELAGKSIAGKTTQKSGLKLVQFAAAQAWERKQWKQAYELYSDIPPASRSLAVWDRLGQLSKKLGKEFDGQGFVQTLLRQQSIEVLVSALDVAKKLGDAELKGVLTDEIRLYLAKTGGYSPKLFKLLHAKDPAWRRLEVFSGITPSGETKAEWLTLAAHAAWELQNYNLVIQYLEDLREEAPLPQRLLLTLAESYRRTGDEKRAKEGFSDYQKSFPKKDSFSAALKGIRQTLDDFAAREIISEEYLQPLNVEEQLAAQAELDEKLHFYREAEESYSELAFLEVGGHRTSYKIGLNAERAGDLRLAKLAYADALAKSKQTNGSWYSYRLGSVQFASGEFESAARSFADYFGEGSVVSQSALDFQRIINSNVSRSHKSLEKLVRYRVSKGPDFARQLLSNSCFLPLGRRSTRINLAGRALIEGEFEVAAELYRGAEVFRNKDGMRPESYRKSLGNKRHTYYLECASECPINPALILWESNHGSSAGCHTLALFRDFVSRHETGEFVHVWAVSDPNTVPSDVKQNPDVVITKLHSEDYLFTLATAKYLVNNVTFAPYFTRRDGQKYLNTWHGTPFKTLGKSMKQGILEHENIQRNFIQATHILAPNELTRWSLIDDHDIDDVFLGKVIMTGSPRLDTSLNMEQSERGAIRKRLGAREGEKIVLFAPTWRGGVSDRELDVEELIADLQALTGAENTKVVFRAHRLSEGLLKGVDLPVTVVPQDIDTNELLAAVDVLVTDYSSILFDYIPQQKPVVLYLHDIEEYRNARALYLELDEVPGVKAFNREELSDAIAHAVLGEGSPSKAHSDRFADFEDGQASKRVNDCFFYERSIDSGRLIDYNERRQNKASKSIVWHASLIPNGIASAGLSLLSELVEENFVINFIVEPKTLRANPDRYEQFQKLPDNVRVICRTVTLPRSLHMMRDVALFKSISSFPNKLFEDAYFEAFDFERRRLFSDFVPDYVVEYDGYADFWLSLLSTWTKLGARTVCYQHNQMYEEMVRKDASLHRTFALYPYFDKLIAVSKSLAEHNSTLLSHYMIEGGEQQTYARNLVDSKKITELAQDSEGLEEVLTFINAAETTFVTVGRLSPEKNQLALLRAMKKLIDEGRDVHLVIVGSGILEDRLANEIEILELTDFVWMTGQVSNPYPLIANADCFVLPSKHEGQPVTILEAMALGVPVITSHLPGCVELVGLGYGLLTETSESAIADALLRFLGEPQAASGFFDNDVYTAMVFEENRLAITGQTKHV